MPETTPWGRRARPQGLAHDPPAPPDSRGYDRRPRPALAAPEPHRDQPTPWQRRQRPGRPAEPMREVEPEPYVRRRDRAPGMDDDQAREVVKSLLRKKR